MDAIYERDNAADPRAITRQSRRTDRKDRQQRADLSEVLGTPVGRRVLMRILYEARVHLAHTSEDHPELTATVFSQSSQIYYHSGRQDLGLLVQGWISAIDPALLLRMIAEKQTDVETEQREARSQRTPSATTGDDE